MLMLMHHFTRRASEWRLARHHLPERHAERVQVRADVNGHSGELLRAGKLWGSSKGTGCRNRGLSTRLIERLSQPEVDDFRDHSASLFQAHHDVAWFDVPMNELLLVDRSQPGSDLRGDFQRQLYLKPTGASDEFFECFSLHELHRVEVILPGSAQM